MWIHRIALGDEYVRWSNEPIVVVYCPGISCCHFERGSRLLFPFFPP